MTQTHGKEFICMLKSRKFSLISLSLVLFSSACTSTPAEPTPVPVDIGATALAVAQTSVAETQAAMPPTDAPIPTPTDAPYYLTAQIWAEEPRVPIINYHQFAPNTSKQSTDHKIRMEDFVAGMDALNQAGFVPIALEDWLKGDLRVPEGKKPVVFTMDDLFYNNQIRLDENGVPLPETGLAAAWEYGQQHPEFGFEWALFSNLGDKWYAEGDTEGKWKEELTQTIIWCIEHDARVYNHTYRHIRLDLSDAQGVSWELQQNDVFLRELLANAGREDLIPQLGNMFAIPFGYWPEGGAYTAMVNYASPEGDPMIGIFDIDWLVNGAKFMPPPYSADFNPLRIPRIAMPPEAIAYLVENKDAFPTMVSCQIGPLDADQISNVDYVGGQIQASIASGACPAGVYIVEGKTFDTREGVNPQVIY
jgi:peptidoglycan/xylan/chitin deacetylase (PgdA/CDA1 family)